MRIKQITLILLSFILSIQHGFGNMASPIEEGTKGSSSFLNQFVEIISERIAIKLSDDFSEAEYLIQYEINALNDGYQIPVVFQAEDYKGGFKILIDGKRIMPEKLPPKYQAGASKFEDYKYLTDNNLDVTIWWTETYRIVENLQNLKYFEINLSQGKHTIEIEYIATPWVDKSKWVKKYSFRYSLSPAKYWKSFGILQVDVDAKELHKKITTNLGLPAGGNKEGISRWEFNDIPSNTIEIKYSPEVGTIADLSIFLEPIGFALIFGIILMITHWYLIKKNRRTSQAKYSAIAILGGLSIPILFFTFWMYSYALIDNIIGKEASREHGYIFLTLLLYPIIMICYIVFTWKLDSYFKRKYHLELPKE